MSLPKTVNVGETYKVGKNEYKVNHACNANSGFWVCVTCNETFNQFNKDTHMDDNPDHVLGWFCTEHDVLEVP